MRWTATLVVVLQAISAMAATPRSVPYPIVDTGQAQVFSDTGQLRRVPSVTDGFYGQDAMYETLPPAYRDNGDGSITDLNTGLIWVQTRGEKVTFTDAVAGAARCRIGGNNDWRMPTIKELYSLINFSGAFHMRAAASTPYLDTKYFGFIYGDESRGERAIDCQDWSSTQYGGRTMNGNTTVFGVNFADGRIKGYPRDRGPRGEMHKLCVRYVRGNPEYGRNSSHDNGDSTVSDLATGLMWSKADSGKGMNWKAALAWVQERNAQRYLGHDDWRLPNAKELQSIVDYTRAPDVTQSAAIDAVFQTTQLGDGDYPFFWTSTTHLDGPPDRMGGAAIYIAFGRATGWMQFPPGQGEYRLVDVHGAGAQRSDPKSGNPADYPYGRGPQGDVIRINNYIRLVRSIDPSAVRIVHPDLTPMPVVQVGPPEGGMLGDGFGPPPGQQARPMRGRPRR